jgi:hypothetical protein
MNFFIQAAIIKIIDKEITMKSLKFVVFLTINAAILPLAGCHHHETVVRERVYTEEPRYVVVQEAPPPVIIETRPAPPDAGYIWIDGYWSWTGHRYAWEHGRWARAPHGHAVWVAPRCERYEHNYHYRPGHWREERHEGDHNHDRR